ncbi:MAG TPA: efflux transporter outer membrane subunit [Roseateles sp.]|nr:efflux transporter outer membrane subunit [Roseateles sp.]HWT54874.1 efflux transporter outer membrane subunit [Rhodocyclaceae bacterium]
MKTTSQRRLQTEWVVRAAAAILASSLLLSGCMSLAPPDATPPAPIAARYAPEATEPGAAAATAWPDYFVAPQLQELIRHALADNRDLRIATLRVEEARAAFAIQRADQLPTVAAQAGGSRALTPGDLNITGQPLYSSQYQVGLGFNAWELDFWGRVRNLKAAALETYLASAAAQRAATLSLIAQTANAYVSLCELNERIDLAARTVASREESYRIFKRRVEVGSTSRFELAQVESLLTQAQNLQAQLEQSRAVQGHALTQLLGVKEPIDAATISCNDDAILPSLAPGLPAELLVTRPDIIAAEHQLKAANANIGAARAAFFPRITLTGAFGSASAELGGLFEAGSRAWNFAPQLTLPIFDSGRNRANLDLAEVRRDIAVANYEKIVQTAFREVLDALSGLEWLARQLRYQDQNLAAQHERARLAKLRYDNGSTNYLEVLDAQRELLNAEQQRAQTRRALLASRINLYAALGGGSLNRDAAAPAIP